MSINNEIGTAACTYDNSALCSFKHETVLSFLKDLI